MTHPCKFRLRIYLVSAMSVLIFGCHIAAVVVRIMDAGIGALRGCFDGVSPQNPQAPAASEALADGNEPNEPARGLGGLP